MQLLFKYINWIGTLAPLYVAEKVTPTASTSFRKPGLPNAEPSSGSDNSEKRPPSHTRQPSTANSPNRGSCQNQTRRSRKTWPIRPSTCPTYGSGLCTEWCWEEGNYNSERDREGSREEPQGAGISTWRGGRCRRLEGSWSSLTKPIKAVHKMIMELTTSSYWLDTVILEAGAPVETSSKLD